MHAAEQPAEIEACEAESGARPIALLHKLDVLDANFTAVHAIHITEAEIDSLRESNAKICACPTTERNLGDGIGHFDQIAARGIGVCFGTDSNTQIGLLEDARELEYHLRLKLIERAVLAPDCEVDSLAARLFHGAARTGAESVGVDAGSLEAGRLADFFTVDLNDPSIAGAGQESLLTNIVFAAERGAIREVFVGGRQVVQDGRHRASRGDRRAVLRSTAQALGRSRMKPVEQLLCDLVSIPSVSSTSNQPVIDYVAASLDPAMWNIRFDSYAIPPAFRRPT